MMSTLGVLLTICLLLFPLTALPLDGDQPADQSAERPAERTQDDIQQHPLYDPKKGCCRYLCPDSCYGSCCYK
uniref:M superfamily MMSK group conopeptide Qc3-YGS01 n=1 Tax=Conus quercinus TaxID=101313 RepID=H2BKN1_CONQU|nr:M superfamily MMSK group conopeptide Qc3-YGS01 [Conus quercinus]